MNYIGSWRTLDPEISGSLSCHRDTRPGFKGLGAEAALFKCVGDRSDTIVSVEDILVEIGNVFIEDPRAKIHIVSLSKVLEGVGSLRIHDRVELVDRQSSTAIDSARLSAVGLNLDPSKGVTHI